MIKIGDLIQEPGKPIVRCTQILDDKDLVWMSLDGKSGACDSIFEFSKLEKKEFTLTPEETINIVCDDRKTPYNLLHMHEAEVRYGDMSNEYTFDIIFEVKETKEQFVIQGLEITEGSCRWFENDTLDIDFLDSCETDEITSFTAKLCVYNPNPPYTIID